MSGRGGKSSGSLHEVKPIDLVFMSLDLTIAPPALKPVSSAQIYKVSGSDLDDPKFSAALARELANRWRAGTRLALVHGGGKELTDLLTALQIPTRFSDGLRVTTRAGRDAALMVLSGLANKPACCLSLPPCHSGSMARSTTSTPIMWLARLRPRWGPSC